jgi:hypothetical protein
MGTVNQKVYFMLRFVNRPPALYSYVLNYLDNEVSNNLRSFGKENWKRRSV